MDDKSGLNFFNEMYVDGELRPAYRHILDWFDSQGQDAIALKQSEAETFFDA